MKEEFWEELLDMFLNHEELQKEHEKLFKITSLIVDHQKGSKKLDEIGKEIAELNKD